MFKDLVGSSNVMALCFFLLAVLVSSKETASCILIIRQAIWSAGCSSFLRQGHGIVHSPQACIFLPASMCFSFKVAWAGGTCPPVWSRHPAASLACWPDGVSSCWLALLSKAYPTSTYHSQPTLAPVSRETSIILYCNMSLREPEQQWRATTSSSVKIYWFSRLSSHTHTHIITLTFNQTHILTLTYSHSHTHAHILIFTY